MGVRAGRCTCRRWDTPRTSRTCCSLQHPGSTCRSEIERCYISLWEIDLKTPGIENARKTNPRQQITRRSVSTRQNMQNKVCIYNWSIGTSAIDVCRIHVVKLEIQYRVSPMSASENIDSLQPKNEDYHKDDLNRRDQEHIKHIQHTQPRNNNSQWRFSVCSSPPPHPWRWRRRSVCRRPSWRHHPYRASPHTCSSSPPSGQSERSREQGHVEAAMAQNLRRANVTEHIGTWWVIIERWLGMESVRYIGPVGAVTWMREMRHMDGARSLLATKHRDSAIRH